MEIPVEEELGLLEVVDIVSISEVDVMTDWAQRQFLLDGEVADRGWRHDESSEEGYRKRENGLISSSIKEQYQE